jgi:hypothetical protein
MKELTVPEKDVKALTDTAYKAFFKELTYVEPMPLLEGGYFDWPVVDTGAFLQRLLGTSSCLQEVYQEAMIRLTTSRR